MQNPPSWCKAASVVYAAFIFIRDFSHLYVSQITITDSIINSLHRECISCCWFPWFHDSVWSADNVIRKVDIIISITWGDRWSKSQRLSRTLSHAFDCSHSRVLALFAEQIFAANMLNSFFKLKLFVAICFYESTRCTKSRKTTL